MGRLLKSSLFLSISLFLLVHNGLCAEPKVPVATNPQFNLGDFSYKSENRRDPFEALHMLKLRQAKAAPSVKKGYELEELKVVGLVKTEKGRSVLMEDMQGKGILFKKGDFINTNLWVTDVLEGSVALAYRLKGETRKIMLDVPRK